MTTTKKRKKYWSKSVGPIGNRIRLYEETQDGNIYYEIKDATLKWGVRTRSLKHKDRARAEQWAKEQVAALVAGDESLRDPTPTAEKIFGAYLANKTPEKRLGEQQADRRRARMWVRFLGRKFDLSKLTLQRWMEFIKGRRGGVITAGGGQARGEK